MSGALERGLEACFSREELERLGSVRVGVAGAGGVGSNLVYLLVRSGIRRLVLVDFDRVEEKNLNRQRYLPEDLGELKVLALERGLRRLSPGLEIEALPLRGDEGSRPSLLGRAELWAEALDGARDKRLLAEAVLARGLPLVACSGMGGIGGRPLELRRMGSSLSVAGDFESDVARRPPYAPRVAACAALMADEMLLRVLGKGR